MMIKAIDFKETRC